MAFTMPFGIRVAAGLLGTAIDRLGRLPGELPTMGVTLAGQLVKTSFRVRQDIADLATRGDDLLSGLTGGAQEHPSWATFDEDEEEPARAAPAPVVADEPAYRPTARPMVSPESTRAAGSATANPPDPAPTPPAEPQATAKPRATAKPPVTARPRPAAKPRVTATKSITPAHSAGTAAPAQPRRATRPAGAPDPVERAGARKPRNRAHNVPSPAAGTAGAGTGAPNGVASSNGATNNGEGIRNRPAPHDDIPRPTTGPIGSNHTFSIAELKERLQELQMPAVRDLLDQEAAGPNRAAYLTLLTNRLTTLEHQNR